MHYNCLCNAMLQGKCSVPLEMNVLLVYQNVKCKMGLIEALHLDHTDSFIAFWYTISSGDPSFRAGGTIKLHTHMVSFLFS